MRLPRKATVVNSYVSQDGVWHIVATLDGHSIMVTSPRPIANGVTVEVEPAGRNWRLSAREAA